MNDPYTVLEVSSHASAAEIKAAYRRLVKQHHPDAGGDDQRMLALNAAWEVLGDQDRRRKFDRTRISPPSASQHPLIIATRIRVVLFHQASIGGLDFGR